MDAEPARTGATTVAGALLLEHAFGPAGLARVVAPIAVGNGRAARLAERLGPVREGTMAGYMTVAGQRRDHDLWAVTADAHRENRSTAGGFAP